MWPGLVGKTPDTEESPISLDQMLEFTANASVDGQKFEGVDIFLFEPHINIDLAEDEIRIIADKVAAKGLKVGSVVAPVWPGTVGSTSMGGPEDREKFVLAVKKACRITKILKEHGVREYGAIRIDSADSPEHWAADPAGNTKRIAETFREAAKVAQDHGERLAAEGEVCWGGMHSWKYIVELLETVGMPGVVGFQADLAHTYLYLLGVNAPEHALLQPGYSQAEFDAAYKQMTDALRPWTLDFHVAQNDGSVHGTGSHDKTGRHCPADDPNGKIDITAASGYWLREANGEPRKVLQHICWDGCMFPNAMLQKQDTWNTILAAMIRVRDAHGW